MTSDTRPDSPTRARNTHTTEYHSLHVDKSRHVLLQDIPTVPQVTWDSLLDATLPPLPGNWATIHRAISSRMIVQKAGQPRWKLLPWNLQGSTESKAFSFVAKIFDMIKTTLREHTALASYPGSDLKCTVAGSTTPLSNRINTSRPDGYLHLPSTNPSNSSLKNVDWADIIMPMEFKKSWSTENQLDDFRKVIWSMHHLMRNDPRRRFTFGLTIENTRVRLWFTDRCGVAASRPFDINKNWEYFARIIVSILLASFDELGYDPDMRLVFLNDVPQYEITVRTLGDEPSTITYRTVEMLSDVGANSMLGRGTRVWKVRELVNETPQGPERALKDVWVHSDRMAEHEILRALKQDYEEYGRYFLTVLAAGYVPATTSHPEVFDDTTKTIRRGKLFVTDGPPLQLDPASGTSLTPSTSKAPSGSGPSVGHVDTINKPAPPEHRDSGHLNIYPRRHYRIVFEEIGTPVHNLRNFSEVFIALEGGSEGLHALHLSHQVHRDVSAGNVMLIRDPNGSETRGVILDFEYVKKLAGPGSSHDVKTGTLAFMACEVTRSSYLHLPWAMDVSTIAPPFRQNALHDLESIWWICLFMIFYLVHPSAPRTSRQHRNYKALFKTDVNRVIFWQNLLDYQSYTSHLREFTQSKTLVEIMYRWKQVLTRAYMTSYANRRYHIIDIATIEEVRSAQTQFLQELREATKHYPQELAALSELGELGKTPPSPPPPLLPPPPPPPPPPQQPRRPRLVPEVVLPAPRKAWSRGFIGRGAK